MLIIEIRMVMEEKNLEIVISLLIFMAGFCFYNVFGYYYYYYFVTYGLEF